MGVSEGIGWETIQGIVPGKSNQYLIGKRGLYKSDNLKAYESSFYLQCNKYRNKGISKEFSIHIRVYYPSRRADLDNSFKVVLDSLQKCGAISNDRNCIKIEAERFIDKTNPRIEFRIIEL
jgi:Holliday junction resolvase RusA-like endonuclease